MLTACAVSAQKAPKPYGLVPSDRQREWYDREMIAFFHFGINTFGENVNEGDGKAPAALFSPTALDCGQWMRTLKGAGIPAAILTAKHADGFCLWPSAYTDYSVKNTMWRQGKGDVVKEFADSCNAYGIKAGIYLGPHDRHEHLHPDYTTERYKDYYDKQLRELLSGYGTIWETWWDGAGASELMPPLYAQWHKTLRELQPHCVIFGAINAYPFADVRWVGNESGIAGDPCWATLDSVAIVKEGANRRQLNEGKYDGNAYIPAESDVSIRPSWFYHASEDGKVKSVKKLWDIFCSSTGRNSVMLINIPPDRRGQLHALDSANIVTLRKGIDATFSHNLLKKSKVSATNVRGSNYAPSNLIDGNDATYYAGKDGEVRSVITFRLPKAETFDCLDIREVYELGQRTNHWSVEWSADGRVWHPIKEATGKQTIGHRWIERFEPVTARYVRLNIEDGGATPAIRSFGIYRQSSLLR